MSLFYSVDRGMSLKTGGILDLDAPSCPTGRDLTAFVWLLWIKNTQNKDKKQSLYW